MTYFPKLQGLLILVLFLVAGMKLQAADFIFTPDTSIVEVGKPVVLSVSGTSGEITWSASKGQIQGFGSQITYIAPLQAGIDVITVLDGAGNVGTIKITVLSVSQLAFSLENANWEVFTNRNYIKAMTFSDDGKTLWVATTGGLEQRNAITKQLEKLFTHVIGGLPSNVVYDVVTDGNNGIWLGTGEGLAHLSSTGEWKTFTTANSELPYPDVQSIVKDDDGGVWIGSYHRGLAYLSSSGQWTVYNTSNSSLPSNTIYVLASDDNNGIWVGTENGVAHLNSSEEWQIFNMTNSGLPNNCIGALMSDGNDGVWVGTGVRWIEGSGLAHLDNKGEWFIFNASNSGLPNNTVHTILDDGSGGLWIGTEYGLAHLTNNNQWQVFNTNNADLINSFIISLLRNEDNELLVGTGRGFASLDDNGKGVVFRDSDLPGDSFSVVNDGSGGIWVATSRGLARLSGKGEWTIFNYTNSDIWSLTSDGNGGLWVGTIYDGIAHLSNDAKWTIFNTSNSDLPSNQIRIFMRDESGGLWVGTEEGGLAYLDKNQEWTIFNTDNSGIPSNNVGALSPDGAGGLWVGTHEFWQENNTPTSAGLAHLKNNNEWEVFNVTNSILPNNNIFALYRDTKGGLWIGNGTPGIATGIMGRNEKIGNLTYLNPNGEWKVFYTANSNVSYDITYFLHWGMSIHYFFYWGIRDIMSDGSDGLWMGTYGGGLAHLNSNQEWTFFKIANSNLPHDNVMSLVSDGSSGLWLATLGGLAHLTFTQKTSLCQTTDAIACQAIQQNHRAAIIIAGGGAYYENTLWDTTEFISSNLYNVLNKRGFDNDEIYYLSPKGWADFNGDGLDDRIVDAPKPERPITIEDVRTTLAWAKSKGELDLPLYLFFIDHGDTDKLQLSKIDKITATEFKTFLDDYQTTTNNEVILVIDACYSGTFLQQLLDERFRRAIISSTGDTPAYFDRAEKQGFSRFLARNLDRGMTFKEAFDQADNEQQKLLGDLSKLTMVTTSENKEFKQIPQLNDGSHGAWLGTHYLNNLSLVTGDDTIAVESTTPSSNLLAGQDLILTAKTSGKVNRVWAVMRPPKMSMVFDTDGTPILAYPRIYLEPVQTNQESWQTIWNNAVYNGDYSVTFYAEDKDRNIVSSNRPLILTVTEGVAPPSQAQIQIHFDKTRYQCGEPFKAMLTEDLSWGYDLYAAVVMPNGHFFTLKNANELRPMDEAKPWYASRKPHSPLTLLDLTLPADLLTGTYCLFGILSPEQNDAFEANEKGLWVVDSKCFEVF